MTPVSEIAANGMEGRRGPDGTPGIGPAVRVDFAAFGESLPSSKLDYGCSSDPAGGLLNELDARREPKLRVDVREVGLHGPG
jgi:hypothetical protein